MIKQLTKRLILTLFLLMVFVNQVLAAGASSTAYYNKVGDQGVTVVISATADASSAAFNGIAFSASDSTAINVSIYNLIRGKWLTSARTIPACTASAAAGLITYTRGVVAPTANYDIYIVDSATATSEHVLTTPTLAIGSTATAVSSVAFNYIVNGTPYAKAAVAAGTAPGNDVIPQSKYGAVAFDIGSNGTIDAIEAAANATGYTSAALAIAGVAAAASDHCRMGYVTATKSDGAFTFGGTDLNAANTTVAYTSTIPVYDIMGGRLTNRSATAEEERYPGNTDGDNAYRFIKNPLMIFIVNNSVNSATLTLDLIFN